MVDVLPQPALLPLVLPPSVPVLPPVLLPPVPVEPPLLASRPGPPSRLVEPPSAPIAAACAVATAAEGEAESQTAEGRWQPVHATGARDSSRIQAARPAIAGLPRHLRDGAFHLSSVEQVIRARPRVRPEVSFTCRASAPGRA